MSAVIVEADRSGAGDAIVVRFVGFFSSEALALAHRVASACHSDGEFPCEPHCWVDQTPKEPSLRIALDGRFWWDREVREAKREVEALVVRVIGG